MSGEPSTLTVIQNGKVSAMAAVQKAQAARNLPSTACQVAMGKVSSSSMVPRRRSSAQRRMVSAGTKSRNSQGRKEKKAERSAWARAKKLPTLKVSTPARARNTTMNTVATGVAK